MRRGLLHVIYPHGSATDYYTGEKLSSWYPPLSLQTICIYYHKAMFFSYLAALLNQQSHRQRTIIALDGCKINSAGTHGEISEICPNVVELDISNNLLHSWEQVCPTKYIIVQSIYFSSMRPGAGQRMTFS